MIQVSEKERAFLEKWKITRQKKWTYIVRNGIVFWGLPVTMITYLLLVGFHLDLFRLVTQTLLSSFMGSLFFYWQFSAQDKRFRQVYSQEHA